uniref:Endoglucanase n=1 Tax=Globodera pallida TaxID=36090 RepID=A0A183C255_GLOPA
MFFVFLRLASLAICSQIFAQCVTAPPYGQLSVSGTKLVGSSGETVALHGNSLFWSQWYPQFWNETTVKALKCNWNANVVRAAMGVDQGGYLSDATTNYNLVKAVIEAAISQGIYVIVDWHVSATYTTEAVTFFTNISKTYGSYPHILYETYNEPLAVSWTDVLVPYHKLVIAAIRANDAKNVIILGTPTWSQDVDTASENAITGYSNLMYTFHFYAATHYVNGLGAKGCPSSSMNTWWAFMDGLSISYLNWAIDDKSESCAALVSGTTATNVGTSSYWTTSGKLVAAYYLSQSNGVSCSSSGSGTTTATTTKSATTAITTKSSSSSSDLIVSVSTTNSWNDGSQVNLVFTNSGSSAFCSTTFTLTLPSGSTIASSWNMNAVSGSATQYTLPSWVNIAAGSSYSSTGMTLSGSGTPTVTLNSSGGC